MQQSHTKYHAKSSPKSKIKKVSQDSQQKQYSYTFP